MRTSAEVGKMYARALVLVMCMLTAKSLVHHDQRAQSVEEGYRNGSAQSEGAPNGGRDHDYVNRVKGDC